MTFESFNAFSFPSVFLQCVLDPGKLVFIKCAWFEQEASESRFAFLVPHFFSFSSAHRGESLSMGKQKVA